MTRVPSHMLVLHVKQTKNCQSCHTAHSSLSCWPPPHRRHALPQPVSHQMVIAEVAGGGSAEGEVVAGADHNFGG